MSKKTINVEVYEKGDRGILKQEVWSGGIPGEGHARFGLVLGRAQVYLSANNKTHLINIDALIRPLMEERDEKQN